MGRKSIVRTLFRALSVALVIPLFACAMTGKGLDPGPSGAGRLGTDRSEGRASDYPVDLAQLIAEAVHGAGKTSTVTSDSGTEKSGPEIAKGQLADIERARRHFYDNCPTNDRCGVLRDRVQDRLIWASESACSDYLSSVRRSFTSTNLNLGGATTLFGALGSVITSVDAARVFSGAAAVTSGVRAEYNDIYFSSQAFELVSKAIRAVREKTLKQIRDARANKGIREYTLEESIGDAARYHATCNVMAGLEEASDAVTRERDPGLRRLNELLQGVGAGVNVSLGTAAIDASSLPSAEQSCQRLGSLAREGSQIVATFTDFDTKVQADPNADQKDKETSARRLLEAKRLAADLAKLENSAKADCTGKDAAVARAEMEMFDAMRIFAGLPLSEKPIGKAKFDAARAKVLALKAKIDAILSDARTRFEGIMQITASR